MAPQQKVQYVAEKVKYFHKIANHPFLSKPIRPVTELTTRLRQKRPEEMIASFAGLFIPHLVPKVRDGHQQQKSSHSNGCDLKRSFYMPQFGKINPVEML